MFFSAHYHLTCAKIIHCSGLDLFPYACTRIDFADRLLAGILRRMMNARGIDMIITGRTSSVVAFICSWISCKSVGDCFSPSSSPGFALFDMSAVWRASSSGTPSDGTLTSGTEPRQTGDERLSRVVDAARRSRARYRLIRSRTQIRNN